MKRAYLGLLGLAALPLATACLPPPPPPSPITTMSGYVRTDDGQPVGGMLVYFKEWPYCFDIDCSPPQTHSDADGFYSLDLPDGTYLAECLWEQLDPKIACWANPDESPRVVSVPPSGQRVDFVVRPVTWG